MRLIRLKTGFSLATCLIACLGVPRQASPEAPSAGIFDRLAGEGGVVTFTTGPHPDGTEAFVRLSTLPDGGFDRMEAAGALILDSPPSFHLECLHLVYEAAKGTLRASGNVDIRQEGIHATAADLIYNLDTGGVILSGSPEVTQTNADSSAHFTGMENFVINRSEDGTLTIDLSGQQPINMEIKPVTPEGGEQPPEDAAAPAEDAAPGPSMMGFGKAVVMVVSPRNDVSPHISSTVSESGELSQFRAAGSIRVESETITLRCDEMTFDGPGQQVEALYNVYLKKQEIEADCGRMVYDLANKKIRLTVNPDVRQHSATSTLHIWNIDHFTITQRPDGGVDVDYGNPDGQSKTEFVSRTPETPQEKPKQGEGAPVEVDVEDPTQLPAGNP